MMKKHTTLKDHRLVAAGSVWIIPEYRLVRMRDGMLAVSHSEIMRVHTAVAMAICKWEGRLTPEEMEFLCDTADVSQGHVASEIGLSRSTLSKWKKSGSIPSAHSNAIKRWFLVRTFGELLREKTVEASILASDTKMISAICSIVLDAGGTFDVQKG